MLVGTDKLYFHPKRRERNGAAVSNRSQFFIVTSEGRTASYWYAAALNSHPDVICGHSKQSPPIPSYLEQEPLTTELLKRVYGDLSRLPVGIDDYYDLVERAGAARVYGTVHAFSLREAHQTTSPTKRSYVLAHLTRHPIIRIASSHNLQRKTFRMSEPVLEHVRRGFDSSLDFMRKAGAQDVVKGIIDSRRLQGEARVDDWLAFASACLDVSAEASHLSRAKYVFPCERITSDPNYFAWAFGILTGGSLEADAGYIAHVFSMTRLNVSDRPQPSNALEIYAGWLPWQKELLSLINRWTNLAYAFFAHGYDLSFIDD
jgi:hypothetical protein